jgi:hypothetical protein
MAYSLKNVIIKIFDNNNNNNMAQPLAKYKLVFLGVRSRILSLLISLLVVLFISPVRCDVMEIIRVSKLFCVRCKI